MRETLSEREEKVFNAIVDFINLNAYPPTNRELCNLTGLTSTSSVHATLKSLETKGYIKTLKNQRRALSIVSTAADMVEVVRCKECRYYFDNRCNHPSNLVAYRVPDFGEHYVYKDGIKVKPDHYCGYGKRKEGANNG